MADQKVKHSTQAHLDIEDIRDNVVLLRNGAAAIVLETSSVNFDLLSEKEQDATIYAYAGLLNSLTFPMQIVIRSRRTDISQYIEKLKDAEVKQKNPDLRSQMVKYRQFISEIVQKNQVLDKRFYVVVPFAPAELGLKGVGFSKKKKTQFSKEYLLEQAKVSLYPKRDQISRQLSRVGLRAQQLNTQQLIELFYDIYNPGQVSAQKVAPQIGSYTTVMVEPAVEGGTTELSPPGKNDGEGLGPPPLEPGLTSPAGGPGGFSTPPQTVASAASALAEKMGFTTPSAPSSPTPAQTGPLTQTTQTPLPPQASSPAPPSSLSSSLPPPPIQDDKYQKMVSDLEHLVQKAKTKEVG